jgi:molybdopterin-guanine dinucleotide biosynthesis protein A
MELFSDKPLIQHVIDSVSQVDYDIIVVAASGSQLPELDSRVRVVNDCYPVGGALVGILTGLKASKSQYNLAVACDMPFLNIDLIRYLMRVSRGYDVVIPRIGKMIEPLHAVYSRNCIGPIQTQIESGNLRISDMLDKASVRYVESDEIERYDPQHLSFININSEEDLKKAKAIMVKARQ